MSLSVACSSGNDSDNNQLVNSKSITNHKINGQTIYAKTLQQLVTGLLYLILKYYFSCMSVASEMETSKFSLST